MIKTRGVHQQPEEKNKNKHCEVHILLCQIDCNVQSKFKSYHLFKNQASMKARQTASLQIKWQIKTKSS